MITLYDHIQELRAELRGCHFTKRERAAVQAELAKALADQTEIERDYDRAIESCRQAELDQLAAEDGARAPLAPSLRAVLTKWRPHGCGICRSSEEIQHIDAQSIAYEYV